MYLYNNNDNYYYYTFYLLSVFQGVFQKCFTRDKNNKSSIAKA